MHAFKEGGDESNAEDHKEARDFHREAAKRHSKGRDIGVNLHDPMDRPVILTQEKKTETISIDSIYAEHAAVMEAVNKLAVDMGFDPYESDESKLKRIYAEFGVGVGNG